jgi:hypothetical protein
MHDRSLPRRYGETRRLLAVREQVDATAVDPKATWS